MYALIEKSKKVVKEDSRFGTLVCGTETVIIDLFNDYLDAEKNKNEKEKKIKELAEKVEQLLNGKNSDIKFDCNNDSYSNFYSYLFYHVSKKEFFDEPEYSIMEIKPGLKLNVSEKFCFDIPYALRYL